MKQFTTVYDLEGGLKSALDEALFGDREAFETRDTQAVETRTDLWAAVELEPRRRFGEGLR